MNTQKLSGLEMLEKFKEGVIPHPTMATTIPMKITEVKKGYIEFRAAADDRHLNPMGGVHGGFAATVLDSAAGSAVHTLLLCGESYGTIDLNVKMLKPVPKGIELRARGKVIHLSRRLGISEAILTDNDGKIYAHATSTCMILREKNSSKLLTFKSPQQDKSETAMGSYSMK